MLADCSLTCPYCKEKLRPKQKYRRKKTGNKISFYHARCYTMIFGCATCHQEIKDENKFVTDDQGNQHHSYCAAEKRISHILSKIMAMSDKAIWQDLAKMSKKDMNEK